jgi:hypothetical protein
MIQSTDDISIVSYTYRDNGNLCEAVGHIHCPAGKEKHYLHAMGCDKVVIGKIKRLDPKAKV